MSYTPVQWVDDETPVNAANLNQMDEGIVASLKNHEILPDGTNLDDISENGVYLMVTKNVYTNMPDELTSGWVMTFVYSDTGVQTVYGKANGSGLYIRRYINRAWTPWHRFATESELADIKDGLSVFYSEVDMAFSETAAFQSFSILPSDVVYNEREVQAGDLIVFKSGTVGVVSGNDGTHISGSLYTSLKGADGKDGFSPELTINTALVGFEKTVTVTIKSEKDGEVVEESFSISDGSDGKDGNSIFYCTYDAKATVSTQILTRYIQSGDKELSVGDLFITPSGWLYQITDINSISNILTATYLAVLATKGDSGTSVTVSSVSESTEDGESNVVTFSDGKTLNVKNGNTGATGPAGPAPVKGVDYWTQEDREKIIAEAAIGNDATIVALPTAAKNLILTLFENAVYVSPLMSSVVEALRSAFENAGEKPEFFAVVNLLNDVTNSNTLAEVQASGSYIANLSCADGYAVSDVTVTMGGVDITSEVYTDGKIIIPVVTGTIAITATAVDMRISLAVGGINNTDGAMLESNTRIYTTDYIPYNVNENTISANLHYNGENSVKYALRPYDKNYNFIDDYPAMIDAVSSPSVAVSYLDNYGRTVPGGWLCNEKEFTLSYSSEVAYIRIVLGDYTDVTAVSAGGTITISGIEYQMRELEV